MEIIVVAVIMGLAGPIILGVMSNKQATRRQERDWERQDIVAARLVKASDDLLEETKNSTATTNQKLEVIRIDVNSNMTAAKQAELDATKRELLLMQELNRPLSTLDTTRARIAELEAQLADRLRATESAEKEGRA